MPLFKCVRVRSHSELIVYKLASQFSGRFRVSERGRQPQAREPIIGPNLIRNSLKIEANWTNLEGGGGFKMLLCRCSTAVALSRKPQYKDVCSRTIEMPQCARIFKVNCCLKVHNAHLQILSPIWDKVEYFVYQSRSICHGLPHTEKIGYEIDLDGHQSWITIVLNPRVHGK